MTITVKIKNGIRYGSFTIHGIQSTFPTQVITSTNLNNAEKGNFSPFDFKTKIVEIIEFEPQKLVSDEDYKNERLEIITKMINKFPSYLFLFAINGAKGDKKTSFKFSRINNEHLIEFQKQCGFKLIKIFLKHVQNISEDYEYYRSIIPKKRFVASLDENMDNKKFEFLYHDCLKHDDEIITFFGRRQSISKNNPDNELNFTFIRQHKNDKILRLTSMTVKVDNDLVSSLKHHWNGLDAYSFMTKKGNQNVADYLLKALNGFKYGLLLADTHLTCTIKKELNLYKSSQYFRKHFEQSSIPVSTHDIVRLNETFETLHKKYTEKSLGKILNIEI